MRLAILLALPLSLPMSAHAACDAPEHRQFDFWLGEWDVVAPEDTPNAGQVLGRNRIERMAAGCGLLENWTGASGFEGKSLNAWDAAHRVWRQFWIGSDGTVLQLRGGLQAGAMVLTGEQPTDAGGMQRQRITWTPAPDGSVTQHWETADAAGERWTTSFLGHYRRVAE